jgi:isoquinoline 1-oxidoreductase beta subunit
MKKLNNDTIQLDRRTFIKVAGLSATAGLTIAFTGLTPGCTNATSMSIPHNNWQAWITIAQNGETTIFVPRIELGQGASSALAMLVAEELDADWSSIKVKPAPLDDIYGSRGTENSESIRSNWMLLRKLGAIARQQLVHAAAESWHVNPAACTTSTGKVLHTESKLQATYGELVNAASKLPLPDSIQLKNPKGFKLIGHNIPRLDIPMMTNGYLKYTADVSLPGLLTAVILHSPQLGGKVKKIHNQATLAIAGIRAVINLDDAVAVIADEYWLAEKGMKHLKVEWVAAEKPALDTDVMWQQLKQDSKSPGKSVFVRGNTDTVLQNNKENILSQEYSLPYYAHACMEPMTCIADVKPGSCEVWAPTQSPWWTYHIALEHGLGPLHKLMERIWLKFTKRASARIKIHMMPVGGGFGRKLYQDCIQQTIQISKAIKAPVKLIWSREQDIKHDLFQPASFHKIRAIVDNKNEFIAWNHRITGSGLLSHETSFPYKCDNIRIEVRYHEIGVPTGSWRSVSDTPNAFARESFINHLCAITKQDPVDYRMKLLSSPRMQQTLETAAKAAGWYNKPANNIFRGVALHECRGSYVAQIVELRMQENTAPKILRVVCAIDCGQVVNPDGVKAQMEGGIVFGLSAFLSKGIQVKNGEVVQSNFHDYEILRMHQMPVIEVHIVESKAPPGGVGETGVPPIGPALHGALMGLRAHS